MGKYQQDATQLLEYVGGKANIAAVSHCVTRMRFVLNNPAKADIPKIEGMKVVKGTFTQAGQFQVIIGNTVSDFYNDFIAVSGIEGVSKDAVKSAATHFMRGTPYIYQGEELGMTNAHFTSIGQYRDVESLNYYEILQRQGHTTDEALEILAARSRDNGRTPMQWSDAPPHAGFTTGTPWIGVVDNYTAINAADQVNAPDSIFSWYRTLVALRKQYKVISEGHIEMLCPDNADLLAYRRWTDEEELLVVCNLTGHDTALALPEGWQDAPLLLGNYPAGSRTALRPYECLVLRQSR